MTFQTSDMRTAHAGICFFVLLSILIWTTVKVCSGELTITTSNPVEQEGIGSVCGTVACFARFPKIHAINQPLTYMEINGFTVRDQERQFYASYYSFTGYKEATNRFIHDHEIENEDMWARITLHLSDIFSCWTGVFDCKAGYFNRNKIVQNETATVSRNFSIDHTLGEKLRAIASLVSIKLSRLTAEVDSIEGRMQEMLDMEAAVESVLWALEPDVCLKKMHAHWRRIIVKMPGFPRVMCDTTTDHGGWIIIQRRINGELSMTRSMNDYKYGFGEPESDYWWGLEHVRALTNGSVGYELRIDAGYDHHSYFAVYEHVSLGSKYQLILGKFSYGRDAFDRKKTPGYHEWGDFTADFQSPNSCAKKSGGGFWFKGPDPCKKHINPSGHWMSTNYPMSWTGVTGPDKALEWVELKIRMVDK